MKNSRSTARACVCAAATAALALVLPALSAQEEKKQKGAAADKPGKEEAGARKKAPEKSGQSREGRAKPPVKKEAEAKVEVRVRSADGGPKVIDPKSIRIYRDARPDGALQRRTWLGIAMRDIPGALREYLDIPDGFGVQVDHVADESPASEAGLEVHDIITTLDDQKVISPEHVALLVRSMKKGDKVKVSYIRKGKTHTADVTLGEKDLPPFSNTPRPTGSASGFGFHFGKPGEERRFEFRLPDDLGNPEEWEKYLKRYQDNMKEWLEKNPDALHYWNRFQQNRPKPVRPTPGAVPRQDSPKPDRSKPALSEVKPIPPLPGKPSANKPPSIMVRPGFPIEVIGGAGVVKIDNPKGAITIVSDDGDHKITIRNKDGETVYEGPFDAEKGSKGLPKEARDQLEEMKMNDLELLAPPQSRKPKTDAPRPPKSDPAKPGGKGKLL